VPLGVHRRSGYWYPFVAYKGGELRHIATTLDEMLYALGKVQRVQVPVELFHAFYAEEKRKPAHTSIAIPSPTHYLGNSKTIADWCADYDPIAFIGQYVRLDKRGLGCCPFGDHHRGGKDTHPSFQVFSPRRLGGVCWRCYTGEISGDIFNFLQLWHGLEAGELWAQLRGSQQH
jgi:hypothetical protein